MHPSPELLQAYQEADRAVDTAFAELNAAASEHHVKDALSQTAQAEAAAALGELDAKTVGFQDAHARREDAFNALFATPAVASAAARPAQSAK